MSVKIKVLCFGRISETVKTSCLIKEVSDLNRLISELEEEFPDIKKLKYQISVNRNIIKSRDYKFSENDEVALLPPFAGG